MVYLRGDNPGRAWMAQRFKLAVETPKTTPHVHAALIKAWADGCAQIQEYHQSKRVWVDIGVNGAPILWNAVGVYRIKPEPKPDVVSYAHVTGKEAWRTPYVVVSSSHNWNDGEHEQYTNPVNAQFIFDGETGKLKSVEMIKEDK